jgi:hypothetical protein
MRIFTIPSTPKTHAGVPLKSDHPLKGQLRLFTSNLIANKFCIDLTLAISRSPPPSCHRGPQRRRTGEDKRIAPVDARCPMRSLTMALLAYCSNMHTWFNPPRGASESLLPLCQFFHVPQLVNSNGSKKYGPCMCNMTMSQSIVGSYSRWLNTHTNP